jgi:hypothetical protein
VSQRSESDVSVTTMIGIGTFVLSHVTASRSV